jgi:hypothetical protein
MPEYDDDVNQQSRDPDQGGVCAPAAPAPGESHEPAEPAEKSSTGEDVASTVHGAAEVVDVAAEMAKAKGLATGATVVGTGIAAVETIHSAVTGEGCAADKAMGIVPLMGPASALMMPSWCGPGPAEQQNFDTGMTPSQERAAGLMTPADPNNAQKYEADPMGGVRPARN